MSENPPNILKTVRMGKPNKNNNRALRVTLSFPAEVEQLIKKGYKLKEKQVFITFDLTSKEREQYNSVQAELKTRKDNGENVVIRYYNRSPSVMQGKKRKKGPSHHANKPNLYSKI